MKTETIEYQDGDLKMRGYLAYDEQKTGKRPGVLVMPEAFGLGPHAKQSAERLAALGYVALAGDPYGDGLVLNDLQEAVKLAGAIFEDPAKTRNVRASHWTSWHRCPRSIPTGLPRSAIVWAVLFPLNSHVTARP